jgi:hypothetical protein
MVFLFLLIAGICFLAHHALLLGIISLVAAFCARHENQRLVCIVLGIVLMFSGVWFVPGLVGFLIGLLSERR